MADAPRSSALRSWRLELRGAPLLMNQVYGKRHWSERNEAVQLVRQEAKILAKQVKIPPLAAIAVDVRPWYPAKGQLPDTAAEMPSVKAAIDGLVDAKVIPKDTAEYVARVTFHAPRRAGEDGIPGVFLTITEELGA